MGRGHPSVAMASRCGALRALHSPLMWEEHHRTTTAAHSNGRTDGRKRAGEAQKCRGRTKVPKGQNGERGSAKGNPTGHLGNLGGQMSGIFAEGMPWRNFADGQRRKRIITVKGKEAANERTNE
ncbi:hypothetical protein niasHT_037477 [Heterodera trifolii]|uniref:Uncharacterized protein n=1 Tax=Heterodera trifolii TaxID=157864 RepID=A0ABD2ILQ1_9BILA